MMEPDDNTKIDLLFNNNIDVDNRTIFLYSEVTPDSAFSVIKALFLLNKTEGDIRLVINSEGGDVSAGLAVMDVISKSKNQVVGYVPGQAASMAANILQACGRREISKYGSLFIHNGSTVIETDIKSAVNQVGSLQKDLNLIIGFWLTRAKVKKKKLEKLLGSDTILYSAECLKFGFVDEIV